MIMGVTSMFSRLWTRWEFAPKRPIWTSVLSNSRHCLVPKALCLCQMGRAVKCWSEKKSLVLYLLHVWNFHSIYTRNSVIQIVLTSLCHELGEISFIIVHVVYTVHLEPLWSGDCYPVRVCAAGLCVWLHWFVYRIWPFKCWAQIDAGSTHF